VIIPPIAATGPFKTLPIKAASAPITLAACATQDEDTFTGAGAGFAGAGFTGAGAGFADAAKLGALEVPSNSAVARPTTTSLFRKRIPTLTPVKNG
jgi:hypothetical protein